MASEARIDIESNEQITFTSSVNGRNEAIDERPPQLGGTSIELKKTNTTEGERFSGT